MITIHHSLLLPTVQSLPSYLSLEVLFFDNQRLSHCFFGIQDTCSYIWKKRNEIWSLSWLLSFTWFISFSHTYRISFHFISFYSETLFWLCCVVLYHHSSMSSSSKLSNCCIQVSYARFITIRKLSTVLFLLFCSTLIWWIEHTVFESHPCLLQTFTT